MSKKQNSQKIIAVCLAITIGLVFGGLKCPKKGGEEEEITLEWWRVNFDDPTILKTLIGKYNETHPNVKINLKTFKYAEYEDEVINAMSASTSETNKGPDIISIHNDWLPRWQDKLVEMPASTEDHTHMNFRDYETGFVQTTVDELTSKGKIYAMTTYVDTLALFYNKDLLDAAGVAQSPATWDEFQDAVKKITKINEGEILQSGAAMGTSTNINRSTDILEAIMLQNGAKMINDDHTKATFSTTTTTGSEGEEYNSGATALEFYTDFANAAKEVYTWNLNQHYSIDAFVAGETAMMINYSFRKDTIKEKSPNLNFGISAMPQVSKNNIVNYPNYWAEAVSNKTQHKDTAWEFIEFITNKDNVKLYNEETERPVSRRDLIDNFKDDPIQGIFAEQALTARSWWKPDNRQIESIFATMIETVNLGRNTIGEALNIAVQETDQLVEE